jgi:cell division protein FtsW
LPWKQWVLLSAAGIVGIVFFIKQFSYRAERVLAWLNPGEYSQTTGYQPIQSLLAIGSGGFTGTGLGMGASKFYYLPEAHTDFAFAIWAQETGFFGATVVLFLMVALACYGIRIGLETVDGRGRVLAYAVVMMIVGQAVGNAAMVLGLLPVTGVPMPFFSYGGSALAVNLWTMGFIFSVGISVLRQRGEPTRTEPVEVVPGKPRLRLVERLEKQGR